MSTPGDHNKIVDLQQRQASALASQDRVGDLLKVVRGTALKRVQGLVSTLFENIDDALFDLAEKAENNAIQTQYFDGMREVRKKRQLVERLFQDHLSKIFNEFAAGKMQAKGDGSVAGNIGDLSLVDDKELEESLAIASTVAKAENRLSRPLYAVNQRLSVLLGGAKVEDATNPIAPAPLCQAFRFAMREMELNLQTQLIIYKLFDRYVMAGLDGLYEEVNEILIQAGVLPQIRHTVAGMGARPARPMPQGGALPPGVPHDPHGQQIQDPASYGGYGQAYGSQYDQAAAQLQAEIYNTVRGLLASRRPTGEAPDYGAMQGLPPGAAPPVIAPTELLSALTLLQNQAMMAQTHASSAADAALTVQQIKQELLDQATKFHGSDKAHVTGADEDTIDLVGMLFEFILQDRNLPPQMQALLGPSADSVSESRDPRQASVRAEIASRAPASRCDGAGVHRLVGRIRSRSSSVRQGEEHRRSPAQGFRRRPHRLRPHAQGFRGVSRRQQEARRSRRAARRRSHARSRKTARGAASGGQRNSATRRRTRIAGHRAQRADASVGELSRAHAASSGRRFERVAPRASIRG